MKRFFCGLVSCFCLTLLNAATTPLKAFDHRCYVGLLAGYGSTTWGHLVPENQNAAMSLSTPTSVTEGGLTGGFFAGYEFIPEFALEMNFQRFAPAQLNFDPMSLFSFNNNGRTELTTHTDQVSLWGKFMLMIPGTFIRAYSSIGAAEVHRYDAIKNIWRLNPTFGAGLNYNLTEHWMGEIGMNYTAGYGEAELDPSEDFVPFLYSGFLRLAYRFS